ncbi:DegT/DnrJ/EryC1/StrS family aminotransferase [Tessaracoccus massiliensis]|uniref:DegT/DnrJ/EryC1/StrS family aminotransferase n=1 Tax=Tessaracoccus massiliensis TaxID=1522311 RepID=UPI0005914694|nr:DegT/DnrJ/EryC1/StrS aminotransferase family protein [Tessaracoccus massiliensis]
MRVPFSPPDIREEDIEAVAAVLRSGWITTGPVGREFESGLADYTGAAGVVCLNSCTAALEVALRLLGIGPGDEVVVPSYTYTASASVVLHVGATLRLVDSAPGQYVPSISQILDCVSSRTKAVVVVDLAGVPFAAEELREELGRRFSSEDLPLGRPAVIVDGAHSLGATRLKYRAGQLGDFTAFSFHAVKNLTTAEGGALGWRDGLSIDDEFLEKTARRLALHGQDKDALEKSKAGRWEYDILEPAHKWNMPDVLAALGLSQLRRYEEMIARRHEILEMYADGLSDVLAVLPHRGRDWRSSAHLALTDLGRCAEYRDEIIEMLAGAGVATNVHYKPLPMLTAYRSLGFSMADYPHAQAQYERVLSLPLHTLMTDEDVHFVITELRHAMSTIGLR